MMFVILFSILNFTLSGVPGGLILVDIWANATTGDPIEFSVEADFEGNGDGYMRSFETRQTTN